MRTNKVPLVTVDEAAAMMGGTLITEGKEKNIYSVFIDSRKVEKGGLFFALKGEKTDGHNFVENAVNNGAACVVIDKNHCLISGFSKDPGFSIIAVDNTLKALQTLAKNYRNKFKDISIIGITGSSGKTTTKELLAAILDKVAPTVMNEGNLNSETGLPLSLFNIRDNHKYGVFELGINHTGEMDVLSDILRPDYAILTNVGTAHIGLLGSKEKIAEEKMKIFHTHKNLKKGIVYEKDDFAEVIKEKYKDKIEYFGFESQKDYFSYEDNGLEGNIIFLEKEKIIFSLIGRHNLLNAAAVIKMAKILNISDSKIKKGVEKVASFFGRGEVFSGNITIIFDGYNSNKESVKAIVDFISTLSWHGRKIILLGSILELGDKSEEIHSSIIDYAIKNSDASLFLYGKEFEKSYKNRVKTGKFIFCSSDFEEMKDALLAYIKEGDLIVLKGSRGMALERFLEIIKKNNRMVINC